MAKSYSYNHEKSPLLLKSEAFAARIVKMTLYLGNQNKKIGPILNQIFRSGTSISANVGESQFAQTPADFITKLHISLKEANETRRWLNLLFATNAITEEQHVSMSKDLDEVIAILIASIKTIKNNNPNLVKN